MADKHKLAEQDYVKGTKYKEIAEKHNVSINTVKSWKQRHGWSREKGAPKQKSVHTKRKGGQVGNQNAKGHGAPSANTNAVTHGLFSKYLPEETRKIANQINDITPLDILWMNIKMQFAQIMRSQQIMHVESKDDLTKEIKKEKESWGDASSSSETEWEIEFAWDKQANFLNAQSRAMGELRSMLKQFTEMANYDDDRALEAEKMKATIDKTKADTDRSKAEIDKLQNDDSDQPIEIMIKRKGDGE
ncbi:phage terminase small subunit [Halobacillus naozhouensis]|uniref:Phage terminase small subunit n=1 Tax=Halobacillus naozhouensis TaxID=554880 RepID=A0ABY8J154_9BACI|nr:phage terminase small subunit [Halobacillus naozhouensis]WFT76232.1 phage terminase small subunit [Halobacillus naozhouensis]